MKQFRSLGNVTRTDENKKSVFSRFVMPVVIAVALIIFCCANGVNYGNPEFLETFNSDDYTDWSNVLNVAEAGGAGGKTDNYAQSWGKTGTMKNNAEDSFLYTNSASGKYTWRYYYEGNNPNYTHGAGTDGVNTGNNGWLYIKGKDLKQKKVVHCIGFFVRLTGTYAKLAKGGSLKLSYISIQMKAEDKWNQDIYCGYNLDIVPGAEVDACFNDGWNAARGTQVGTKSTDATGQTGYGNLSPNVNIKSADGNNAYIFIWGIAKTDYVPAWWQMGAGGRFPAFAIQNISFKVKATDGAAPSITLNTNNLYLDSNQQQPYWTRERAVSVNISDPGSNYEIYDATVSYPTDGGGTGTTKTKGPKSNNGYTYTAGSQTDKANQVAGTLTVTATDYGNNKAGPVTFSAAQLKLDRTAPSVSSVRFRPKSEVDDGIYNNSTNLNTQYYSGAITLIMYVTDSQSGVKEVKVTNTTTGSSGTATKIGNTNYYRIDALGGKPIGNGDYKIEAFDKTLDSIDRNKYDSNVKTVTTYMWKLDTVAPTIDITINKETSMSAFVNTALVATIKVIDRAEFATSSALYKNADYQAARGKSGDTWKGYTFTMKYEDSGNRANIIANLKSATFNDNTGELTFIYEALLPYCGSEAYSFKAIDNAKNDSYEGNSTTEAEVHFANNGKTLSGQSSLSAYIDTIAPRVTDYILDGVAKSESATDQWIHKDEVELTINMLDTPASTDLGIIGANTGSGLASITVYAYGYNDEYIGSYTDENGNSIQCSFTAPYSQKNVLVGSWKITIKADYYKVAYYYFYVTDHAGNNSWMQTAPLKYSDGTVVKDENGATLIPNYTIKADGTRYDKFYIYKDSTPVTVETYSDEACTKKLTGADEYYTLPWSNKENETIYVKTYFGPSGGDLVIRRSDGTEVATYKYANPVGSTNMTVKDGTGFGAYRNYRVYKFETLADGLLGYTFTFTNGAKVSANGGTVITRMDRTPLSQELFAFGTEGQLSAANVGKGVDQLIKDSKDAAKSDTEKPIRGYISEKDLYNSPTWYNNLRAAFIKVSDRDANGHNGSGTDQAEQYYGFSGKLNPLSSDSAEVEAANEMMKNSGNTQQSKAKAIITFEHNGYTYVVSDSAYYTNVGFTNDSNSTNEQGDEYVLAVERLWTPVDIKKYAVNGNYKSIVNDDGSLDILKGKEKPLTYRIEISDFVGNKTYVTQTSSTSGTARDNLEYKVDPFPLGGKVQSVTKADGTDYECTALHGEWTKQEVTVTFNITGMGLSRTWVEYALLQVVDTPDQLAVGAKDTSSPSGVKWIEAGVGGASSEIKIVFSDVQSKCVQLFLRVRNNSNAAPASANGFGPENNYIFIRQDVDPPQPIGVFFSTNPNIEIIPNPDVLLRDDITVYYEITKLDGDTAYSFIRRTPDRSADIWVDDDVYMYIIASDCIGGNGMGSGIAKIIATSTSSPAVVETMSEFVKFDSEPDSGYRTMYRSAKQNYGYLTKTEAYGFSFEFYDKQNNFVPINDMERDTDNHKLMPIVDKVIPSVSLESATYGNDKASYLENGKFAGSDDNPVKSDINAAFKYVVGISDAQIYVRLRDWNTTLADDDELIVKNSVNGRKGFVRELINLDLENDWTAIPTIDESGRALKSYSGATGVNGVLWSYNIYANAATIKNGYDVLIIAKNGLFYYFDAGNVFIDTEPPTIDRDLSFMALATNEAHSNTDGLGNIVVNYDELNVLTGDNYTNDNLYAYFHIQDLGSGVHDVYSAVAGMDKLEKVTVLRDGKEYPDYYRLELNAAITYYIVALDTAGNDAESWSFIPKIDKTDLKLAISAVTAANEKYASGAFTNEDYVDITLAVNYGPSGFKGVVCSYDNWSTQVLMTEANYLSAPWEIGVGTARATFRLSAEQKNRYLFRAYNGVLDENAVGGKRPVAEDNIDVNIDRTAPIIDIENDGGNFVSMRDVWHGEGWSLKIFAYDPNGNNDPMGLVNPYASEINDIKIKYSVSGLGAQEYAYLVSAENDGYFVSVDKDGNTFTLDYYENYQLVLTDKAGNTATVTLLPRVDTVTPSFGLNDGEAVRSWKSDSIEATDFTKSARYNGEWTNANVQSLVDAVYSISGAYIEYSTKEPNGSYLTNFLRWDGGEFAWVNEGENPDPVPGQGGTTKTHVDYSLKFGVATESSLNKAYKIRLVSNAGRVSEELIIGDIKIDKVKPNIDATVSAGLAPYGTKSGYVTTAGANEWSSGTVKIVVSSTSTLVSGFTLYYNVNQSNADDWQPLRYGSAGGSNLDFDYEKKTLTHMISSSVNNTNYKYKFVSNSGMESEVYYVNGVKIDWYAADLSINAETSLKTGTPQGDGKLNVIEAKDYLGLDNYSWRASNNDKNWTNLNSVIIRVRVSNIGYSGATLYINEIPYTTVAYEENGSNEFIGYYAITESVDKMSVKVVSGAGKSNMLPVTACIDNSIPVLLVSSIDGRKSTNWDERDVNSCWYVSSLPEDLDVGAVIRFAIGKLVKNEDGNYEFVKSEGSDGNIDSGFEIQYTLTRKSVPDEKDWVSNRTSTLLNVVGSEVTSEQYRFRIKSGSGMCYTLGLPATDNEGNVVRTQEEMVSLASAQGGEIRHLSDTDFVYFMNVDSNVYRLENAGITQTITVYANGDYIDVNGNDYADYKFEKLVNGKYVAMSAPYTFKHGDFIMVSYTANEYIHRYTEYAEVKEGAEPEIYGFDSAADELNGNFTFRITDANIKINSYFLKELEVTYGGTVMYLQENNQSRVTALATYVYTNRDGVTERVNIPLNIAYTDMNGNSFDGQFELGGYIVNTTVEEKNSDSFRLTNPSTVLLVKYFKENGKENSLDNPYIIGSQADLDSVSQEIYDGFTYEDGKFVLSGLRSNLSAHYVLSNDIEIDGTFNGIEGNFVGTLDGNNYTIRIAGGRKEGTFGFFQSLGGTVDRIAIELIDNVSLENAENAGILAAVIDGGTVGTARVSGYIDVISANAGANVGGLAGKTVSANIGGANKPVYANTVIFNRGNDIAKANIGGLIGMVGENTTLQKTYTYSHLTVYNVNDDVKVGAVFGNADNIATSHFASNRYFADNTFVNDELRRGFGGVANNINDANESKDTIKGVNYELLTALRGDGAIGNVDIVGKSIRSMVLDKLYADFGMDKGENYDLGTGTESDPLKLAVAREMRAIDEYMNLSFTLTDDVDMKDFGESIGLHKVFGGSFDADGNKLKNFGSGFEISDGDRVGLFAALSGTVKNVVMTDVSVNISGNDNAKYVGVIAGKLLNGVVANAIALGTVDVEKNGLTDVTYAGAVAGYAEGGAVYDVFSIVNVKIVAESVAVGGILGYADGTKLSRLENADGTEVNGAVFGLGRVESEARSSIVGAIFADGSIAPDSGTVYAVKENAYSNKIVVTGSKSDRVKLVSFADTTMRGTAFSNGDAIFEKVFKTDGLYYLKGAGTDADKFTVSTEEDFKYIEHMLYASYNVVNNISFTSFKTIGVGLKFTGSIDGKNADSNDAEESNLSSLMNVTDALIYNNAGRIADININVFYDKTVGKEGVTFGAVAIINSVGGTIRNVTVSGKITINSEEKNSTVIASGFVGIAEGGVIEDNKIQNSISGLSIKISNAATVYAGGYIGRIDGTMTLSYGIGNGTLEITDCGNVYAGTLVGAAYKDYNWTSLEETEEYRYAVTVNGEAVDKLFGYEAMK